MLNLLRNIKVKTRLWVSFGLLTMLMVGTSIFAVIQMRHLAETTEKLYYHPFTISKAIREVNLNIQKTWLELSSLLLAKDNTQLEATIERINTLKKETRQRLTILDERFLGKQEEVDNLVVQFDELNRIVGKSMELFRNNKEEVKELLSKGDNLEQFEKIKVSINYITDFSNKKAEAFMENARLQVDNVYQWMFGVIAMITMIAIWMTIAITRAISNPLNQAVGVANAISSGSLDTQIIVTTKNEMGQLLLELSCMQAQLRQRFEENQRITEEMRQRFEEDKQVADEINTVTHAASQADFSKRVNVSDKVGTLKIIGESINLVLDFNQLVIKDLMRVFSNIAQGNLTESINNDYSGELAQLKHDANTTVQKLTDVLTSIRQSAEIVSMAAEEISEGNSNLSQRTTQQAASLEETAASMEEMTVTVQQNAENAKQANQLAMSAKERAEQGNRVVLIAVSAINEVSKSSKKITEIISVIDEIAFQTNLLALNAAVEAARAGEHGRGFAVVASEVRSLAQRSASAAKEIKSLIQDSNTRVEESTRLANQSGQALEEIVIAVKKVGDIIAEIAAASSEQSANIEQVNKAVTQMDEMVEQNSALVEEAAAASESMKEQALELKKQVEFFNIGELVSVVSVRSTRESKAKPLGKTKTVVSKSLPQPTTFYAQKKNAAPEEEWKDF